MRSDQFRARYVEAGGSADSANSYVTYLNRVDRACGGIDAFAAKNGLPEVLRWAEYQPVSVFGSTRNRRDSVSALRKYIALMEPVADLETMLPAGERGRIESED